MALALLGTAYLVLTLIATLHPTPLLWGVHLPAFLSPPARLLVFALLTAGVACLAASAFGRRQEGRSSAVPSRWASRAVTRWAAWLLLPALGVVFWALRTRAYLLGDQAIWIDRLRHGTRVVYSEPLSALAWRGFRDLLLLLGIPIEPFFLAILPALCGVLAIPLCLGIGRELSHHDRAKEYAAVLFLTGTSQLYFGYIETYPIVAVAVLSFLWLGLRASNGRAPIFVPALALALAVCSHLAALFLVPAYLFLVLKQPTRWAGRLAAIALPPVAIVAIFWLMQYGPQDVLRPFRLVGSAFRVAAESQMNWSMALLQPVRIALDLGNLLLLVALAPVMLIAATIASRRMPASRTEPDALFLALAALSGLLVVCALIIPGSPAQDWDLLSICALPTLALGVAWGRDLLDHASPTARGGLLLLSTGALLSFVLVNADPAAGVRRFETLMSEAAPLSPHERAYGSEKLADHYVNAGNPEKALLYAERALAADSASGRYSGKVGEALYRLGRYSEAIPYFERAAGSGELRGPALFYVGSCYIQMEEPKRAIAFLREAVRTQPGESRYWGALGLAFISSGDVEQGRAIWRRTLARWPDDHETRAAYRMVFGSDPEQDPTHGGAR